MHNHSASDCSGDWSTSDDFQPLVNKRGKAALSTQDWSN